MRKKYLLKSQECEEIRNNERIDIAFRMIYAGEPEEKIVKYTKIDTELLHRMIAVKEDLTRQESEAKSRSLVRSLRMQEPVPRFRLKQAAGLFMKSK